MFLNKSKVFLSLTKARLSFSVVFSTLAGYVLAVELVNFSEILLLLIGGYCMVGASNSFNQITEKDKDALMDRTKTRPLPTKEISTSNAFWISVLLTIAGLSILYTINYKTAFFAAVSVFIYTCIYTPLKPITPLSVFVGAIPGAIPFMLGWVAATNSFGIEPGTLFMIQFFWQFPHFWALAWRLDDDYKKAGFRLLPSGKKDKKSSFQIMLYSAFLIPVSMLPWAAEICGLYSMIVGVILSIIMYYPSVKLFFTLDSKYATRLMFYSFIYLPLIFSIYCLDLT